MTIKLNPSCDGVHRRVIRQLLQNGFQVNVPDEYGRPQFFNTPFAAIDEVEAWDGGRRFEVYTDPEGVYVGTVLPAIGCGNQYNDTVADWSWREGTEGGDAFNAIMGRAVV